MGRLEGKVAVVTGAASGIGAATAARFAEEGATVAALDLNTPLDEIWGRVLANAPDSLFAETNVADEASVKASMETVVDRLGHIDVLVNAAGVIGYGSAHDLDSAEYDRIMNVNVKGSFLTSKYALADMLKRNAGSIVHIASVEGLVGLSGALAYNASKGAVVLMTKNMAIDYSPKGIRVNCVCPGGVETGMTAMLQVPELKKLKETLYGYHLLGRFGKPEEIAAAILFLASDEASFVTGSAMVVDGGYTAGHRAPYTG